MISISTLMKSKKRTSSSKSREGRQKKRILLIEERPVSQKKRRATSKEKERSKENRRIKQKSVRQEVKLQSNLNQIMNSLNKTNSAKERETTDAGKHVIAYKAESAELSAQIASLNSNIDSGQAMHRGQVRQLLNDLENLQRDAASEALAGVVQGISAVRKKTEEADQSLLKKQEELDRARSLQRQLELEESRLEASLEALASKETQQPALVSQIEQQAALAEALNSKMAELLARRKELKELVNSEKRRHTELDLGYQQMNKRQHLELDQVTELEVEIRRKKRLAEELEKQAGEASVKSSISGKKSDAIDLENTHIRADLHDLNAETNKLSSDIGKFGALIGQAWKKIEQQRELQAELRPKFAKLQACAESMTGLQLTVRPVDAAADRNKDPEELSQQSEILINFLQLSLAMLWLAVGVHDQGDRAREGDRRLVPVVHRGKQSELHQPVQSAVVAEDQQLEAAHQQDVGGHELGHSHAVAHPLLRFCIARPQLLQL